MGSKVGESERNISRALKLAEAVSPCVLWIDEIEKGLSGMGSSDKSDAGTLSRVVQELLTWLSDKEAPVFVVATANNINGLSPEMTRAGRFDEIFYVSLPHESERADIFTIHLKKRGYDVVVSATEPHHLSSADVHVLAERTTLFSGAEIEQVISEAGRRAYALYRKGKRTDYHMTVDDLIQQVNQMIPLAKRNPDLIAHYTKWAKTSAKCASSIEKNALFQNAETRKSNRLRVVNRILDM